MATKPPLLLACEESNRTLVKKLITQGTDVTCRDSANRTALHHASDKGWLDVVELLVRKGAELDVISRKRDIPLLLAARRGHKSIVLLLINAGADITCCAKAQRTVLWYALKNGWLEVMQLLEKRGVDFNVRMPSGEIPLLKAADKVQKQIVQFLIETGVSLNCSDEEGWTVLHYASLYRWPDVAQYILERGGDVNARASDGRTPLHYVCLFPRYLRLESETELISVSNEIVELLELLCNKGADINAIDEDGWTVLHYASKEKWPDVVRYILERGGDVNARESMGNTPLQFACNMLSYIVDDIRCQNALVEVVELLCNYGADTNARNSNGVFIGYVANCSLFLLETSLKLKVFNCLFKAGANCNLVDDENKTLFHSFIDAKDIDLVRLGIENGGYFEEGFSPDEHPDFKVVILRDLSLCTRALINKYNEKDLPKVYELCHLSDNFPSIKNMKITYESGATQDIEGAVRRDMEAKGYCNVPQVTPLALSMLTVKSILSYFNRNFN